MHFDYAILCAHDGVWTTRGLTVISHVRIIISISPHSSTASAAYSNLFCLDIEKVIVSVEFLANLIL